MLSGVAMFSVTVQPAAGFGAAAGAGVVVGASAAGGDGVQAATTASSRRQAIRIMGGMLPRLSGALVLEGHTVPIALPYEAVRQSVAWRRPTSGRARWR